MNAQAQQFLPIENSDKRLNLQIHDDQVVLTLSTWAEGLGWCGQKTMAMDVEMIDEMHRLLGAARVRLASRPASMSPDPDQSGRLINFPVSKR